MKKWLALVAVGAAVGLGIAYAMQKKDFRKSMNDDEEFDDDDFSEEEKPVTQRTQKYTSLNANKEEFIDAAKNTLEAAKGMVKPAKNMAVDIKDILAEKADDAGIVASDYYKDAKEKVEEVIGQAKVNIEEIRQSKEKTEDDVQLDIMEDIQEEE